MLLKVSHPGLLVVPSGCEIPYACPEWRREDGEVVFVEWGQQAEAFQPITLTPRRLSTSWPVSLVFTSEMLSDCVLGGNYAAERVKEEMELPEGVVGSAVVGEPIAADVPQTITFREPL